MKLAVLAAVTGFAVAGVASAEGYDPIETRQAGQDLVAADFVGIRAVVNAKDDVKAVANPEGDCPMDTPVPDPVSEGERARTQYQSTSGDLGRLR
jgi:hypothetical protein